MLWIRIGFNADPDTDADPDPAFFVNLLIWIQIQGFDDQKLEKIYSWKKIDTFDQKLQCTYP